MPRVQRAWAEVNWLGEAKYATTYHWPQDLGLVGPGLVRETTFESCRCVWSDRFRWAGAPRAAAWHFHRTGHLRWLQFKEPCALRADDAAFLHVEVAEGCEIAGRLRQLLAHCAAALAASRRAVRRLPQPAAGPRGRRGLPCRPAAPTPGGDEEAELAPLRGRAQINGWRGEIDTPAKARRWEELDLGYIQNWSLTLDLRILLLTILGGFRTRTD